MNLLSINSINPDPQLSAAIAIYFARLALPVWKRKYPEDSRPEGAIEAAEKVLFAAAADGAYAAANVAARVADVAVDVRLWQSTGPQHPEWYAGKAAANCAFAVIREDHSANLNCRNVMEHSALALGKSAECFAHYHLTQLLPLILWHKMNSKRSFAEPEKVFELLPEACKEDFLFNLDSLR
jgi:hypothetical protein